MDDYIEDMIALNDETHEFMESIDSAHITEKAWVNEDYDIDKVLIELLDAIDDSEFYNA